MSRSVPWIVYYLFVGNYVTDIEGLQADLRSVRIFHYSNEVMNFFNPVTKLPKLTVLMATQGMFEIFYNY